MLYSAHPAIPSKTVPSTYTTRPCSITSAPHISQSWEDNSSRLSPTLHDSLPVLPVMIPLQTSYMEEAWVEIRLEVHSLEIDDGSSDTCPALNGPNPLIADLLPYCLTNFSQNELHGGRSRSLSSISGHESYPEYLFEGFAGDDQGFFIANFALFVILVPTLLLLRSLSHRLEPLSFTRSQPMRYRSKPNRDLLLSSNLNSHKWGLGFAKISQIYERFRQSLEPEVSAGKTRIRWKCRCGRRLYDDFEELRPGAIARLERSLNKASEVTDGITISRLDTARLKLDLMTDPVYSLNEGADEANGIVLRTDQELSGLKAQVTFDPSNGTFGHSLHEPDRDAEPLVQAPMDRSSTRGTIQSQATGLGDSSPLVARDMFTGGRTRSVPSYRTQNMPKLASEAPNPPHPESLFLLLCIPHRKYATKLIHMDVCTLLSDRLFFRNLKSHHRSMRGRWVSFFSLRQLRSIRFVKFEMYPSTLVDIRKTDDIPPETHKDEYRYRPIPAEVIPPIGENHLMHLYDYPEDAEDTAICLDKVPKKLRERLGVCPQRGTGLGWGIHFVEGLHWIKLWILGFIGLLMSIAFGIAWACVRTDVQGGFGIAACMMVGLTFTTGVVQAALEPK